MESDFFRNFKGNNERHASISGNLFALIFRDIRIVKMVMNLMQHCPTDKYFDYYAIFLKIRLLAILFVLFSTLQAQNPSFIFDRINVEDGLSNNSVRCILKDSRGVMWFGTDEGLNMYNGYEIKVFRHDPKQKEGLSNNFIRTLHEDKSGNIWIGTDKGLNVFNPVTQTFTIYSQEAGLADDEIYAVLSDKKGTIWVGTKRGVSRYNSEKENFESFQVNHNGTENTVYSLYEMKSGKILAGTSHSGLRTYDPLTDKFEAFSGYPVIYQRDQIHAIYEDSHGNLWLGTKAGLRKKSAGQDDFQTFVYDENNHQLTDNHITSITEDLHGNIWIGTKNGGVNLLVTPVFDYYSFMAYRNDFNDERSLSSDAVSHLYTDLQSGMVWIGTLEGGLSVYDPGKYRFELLRHEINNDNSLNDNFVRAIYEDQQQVLWIGTREGLNRFDQKTGIFTFYRHSKTDANSISENQITAIAKTHEGSLWVGTTNGLNRLSPDSPNRFQKYLYKFNDKNSLSDDHIVCLFQDSDDILWVGTLSGGINKFDFETGEFTQYLHEQNNPNSLSDNVIRSICEDNLGNIWIATAGGGLNQFNKKTEAMTVYKHNPSDPTSLAHNSVKYLYFSKFSGLWVGTHGGLSQLNLTTKKFTHYNTSNSGLPNNNIHGILEDKNQRLWISSNQGISSFNVGNQGVKNYDRFDNLQGDAFNNGSCFINPRTGKMYFGGKNGLNSFFPNKITKNQYIPNLIISRFTTQRQNSEAFSQKILTRLLTNSVREIYLEYSENTFTIELASLSYRHPEKNRYQIRMEGLDETWHTVDNRFITFRSLPAGQYVFHAKGSNNDGVWGKPLEPIVIVIKPPFWESWLFRALIVILIGFLIYGLYLLRVQKIKEDKRKLELEVKRQTKHIEAQNDELKRAMNALEQRKEEILAQKEEIESKNTNLKEANHQVTEQRNKAERSYSNIKIISEIGRKITAVLHHDMVVDTVFENVKSLMDVAMFRIGTYDSGTGSVSFQGFMDNSKMLPYEYASVQGRQNLSAWCITNGEEIFINDFDKEYELYSNQPFDSSLERPGSVIYVPLLVEDEIIGVLTVQSRHKDAYTEEHLTILSALANYTSIALDNAITYGQLQETQKQLADKNESIVSSIRYAERIQEAILPRHSSMCEKLPEHFIIFRPKDIVSGDFYWIRQVRTKLYVAVSDCTGHGVPGAFMSMIGTTLLNEIVGQKTIYDPAQILEELHIGIRESLKQENNVNTDGMDIALCMFENHQKQVTFASAKRPLYHGQHQQIIEIRGDRKAIGGRQKEARRTFTDVEVSPLSGDMLYLTSDGYVDQNGDTTHKFGSHRLKELLQEIQAESCQTQRQKLIQALETHQGKKSQRDDITILGIRIQ